MTTYNTGNPIGSTDARDLYDNAQAFDQAINSSAATYTDRNGVVRKTLKGFETAATGIPAVEASIEAEAAKVAAETARDAAFVNANVYADTTAGLAGTTNGQQFQVVSGGEIIRYKNNSGSAVEVARYPSYGGMASYAQGGFNDLRVPVDLKTAYTWTTGILEPNGTVLAGYSNPLSPLIPVTPKATVIKLIATNNYDTTRPNILGYNSAQQPVQTLLANGTVNATATSPAYVTIPGGIAFVRICGTTVALAEKKSVESIILENLQTPYLSTNTGQYFVAGGAQYLSTDTVAPFGGNGTGYVPVQVGDTLRYRGYALQGIKGAGFFDSNKNFVRRWLGDVGRGTVYEYTLNALDDANVAYVVATDYLPDGTGFFTVERNKNEITKIKDRTFINAYDSLHGRGKAKDSVLSNATRATAGLKYPRYTITGNPGYVAIDPMGPMDNIGHTFPIVAVKVKLVSLPSGTSTPLSWYNPGNNKLLSAPVTINVGDTVTMWNASDLRYFQSSVVGAVFDIIDSVGFWLDADFAATLTNNEKTAIASDPLLFKRDYLLANYAKNAAATDKINTIFKAKRLVTFGDSVMASFGVPEIVADNMQMPLTQLAVSGSTPYANSNLSDAQLALIPSDAAMVIITGGANLAAVISGDITTRDRTKAEGTINYAMDWIYTNRPSCRVMLATPPTRDGASLNWSQVYRDLAVYRKVPLADMDRDADINASNYNGITQYDGVHPTAEGVKRMAGVLIGALKRVIY